MNGRTWTKQEDDHLREHWGRLKTAEIGRTINRSASSVRGRAQTLGLRRVVTKGSDLSKRCIGCKYWSTRTNDCNYILDTKRKRPCKSGEGCTVREIGKRKPKDADLDLTGHAPYNDYYMFER